MRDYDKNGSGVRDPVAGGAPRGGGGGPGGGDEESAQ